VYIKYLPLLIANVKNVHSVKPTLGTKQHEFFFKKIARTNIKKIRITVV